MDQNINITYLELGLYEVTKLMKGNLQELPEAFDLLAPLIKTDKEEAFHKDFEAAFLELAKDKLIIFLGLEVEIVDALVYHFDNAVIVPNDSRVDYDRIRDNYLDHPNIKLTKPTQAADLVCPDTLIVVPVYPLEDGTCLSYNYPGKLLTRDVMSSAYQIIGVEMCTPLPAQYGFDFTGLSSVLTPINPNYITIWKKYY